MKFYCLHYSLRKNNNTLDRFFDLSTGKIISTQESASPQKKKKENKSTNELIDEQRKVMLPVVEKILIDYHKYIPGRKNENTLLFGNLMFDNETMELRAGRIGKEKTEDVPVYDEKDSLFDDNIQLQYPNVLFLWDRSRQMIAIERDRRKFPNEEHLFKSIEKHINKYLISKGWTITINPIYTEETFWEIISENKHIKQVEFTLETPNFFGTPLPLKRYMDKLNQKTNAIKLKAEISNENGNLKIDKTNKEIAEAVEWSNKGEGAWRIETEKGSYTSTQKIIYVEINKQRKDVKSEEDIEEMIDYIGKEYDKETRK